MNKLKAVTAGLALAVTAVVLNTLCAAAVALWPDAMIAFANSWAHGVDLKIIKAAAPAGFGSFIYGLVSLAAVGFAVGTMFVWIYNALGASRRSGR